VPVKSGNTVLSLSSGIDDYKALTMACAPFPVAVNVGNVTLTNGNLMRGISIGVGSPVQDFAFMPNL
jgi:hypothetical protein